MKNQTEIIATVKSPAKDSHWRQAKGFSLKEIKESGNSINQLNDMKINIDYFRNSTYPENIERLKNLAREEGVADKIDFKGFLRQYEVQGFLKRAKVGVSALAKGVLTRAELYSSPTKIFEYMANGAAVVATSVSSIEQFLTDERNSLMAEPNDPESIAKAINRLLDDDEFRKKIAEQAIMDVQEYSFENRAHKIIEFTGKILSGA